MDPKRRKTKESHDWRFGMKAHIGVDAGIVAVVTVEATAVNVRAASVASKPLRGTWV